MATMTLERPIIATTRFEEKGVELQETARNWDQAVERFNGSCTRCTLFHRHAECEACPIKAALEGNVKFFGQPKDYPWIGNEATQA